MFCNLSHFHGSLFVASWVHPALRRQIVPDPQKYSCSFICGVTSTPVLSRSQKADNSNNLQFFVVDFRHNSGCNSAVSLNCAYHFDLI